MSDQPVFDGINEDAFLAVMHELGFAAELVRGTGGRGYIRAPMGPLWYVVYFFNGKGETSQTVASFVTFLDDHLPLAFHNRWNRVHLFPKAIAGNHGETVLEMNVVLRGVTKAYLKRCLTIWHNAVWLFLEEASRFIEHQPDEAASGPGAAPGP